MEEMSSKFAMKSAFFTVFFILLPSIVIIVIKVDIKRTLLPAGPPPPLKMSTRNQSAVPVIYAITPTYTRPVQKAELTRLAQAFRQVSRFRWLVVEDSALRTELVARFLNHSGVPFTHLNVLTSSRFKRTGMPRATEQRNLALTWLREHRSPRDSGVVYFADDDNVYSLQLFEEMRSTQGVSVWPVGFAGGRSYERPLVSKGKVVGWFTGWKGNRSFAIDMAGFAVNLRVILANPHANFKRQGSKPGMQESDFLSQITKISQLEPKANNCTQVLVWHTRTEKPRLTKEKDTVVVEV